MVIRDENLKRSIDYNQGQIEAAHRILIELVNLLAEYQDNIMVIGGWIPEMMFPGLDHIGSIDVDVLVNHLNMKEAGYQTIERILLKNDYSRHPEKSFSFVKTVVVEGEEFPVDVDILAGKYGGSSETHRSQHIHGVAALKATGGNFAFEVAPNKVKIAGKRPDGADDSATVNLVAVAPFLMMKAAALGRGKPKDAYDIFFVIKNYPGGIKQLAEEFAPFRERTLVKEGLQKLADKFASVKHAGPVDVADFLEQDADSEEKERIKRDVYECVSSFLKYVWGK